DINDHPGGDQAGEEPLAGREGGRLPPMDLLVGMQLLQEQGVGHVRTEPGDRLPRLTRGDAEEVLGRRGALGRGGSRDQSAQQAGDGKWMQCAVRQWRPRWWFLLLKLTTLGRGRESRVGPYFRSSTAPPPI